MNRLIVAVLACGMLVGCGAQSAGTRMASPEELRSYSDNELCVGYRGMFSPDKEIGEEVIRRDLITREEGVAINNGDVYVGMSRCALLMSRGRPTRKHNYVGEWGRGEVFTYSDYGPWIYVVNGKVVGWDS